MNRLRWIGIQLVAQMGWSGVLGLLLLLGCGLFYIGEVLPLQQRMALLSSDMAVSKEQSRSTSPDPQAEVEAFRRHFQGQELEAQLNAIHDAGRAAGLTVNRIEYRMLEEKRSQLKQYQIVMPVTSSYPRIRQFVSLALVKVPAMSLDHIGFLRKKVGDSNVEAELRFTLFLAEPV